MVEVGMLLIVAVVLMWSIQNTQEISSGNSEEGARTTVVSENVWAVKLDPVSVGKSRLGPGLNADTLAKQLNMINRGKLEPFDNVYQFELLSDGEDRHSRTADHYDEKLREHSAVLWSSRQRPLKRTKRELDDINFNDPVFKKQWHLVNLRERGHDINVTGVWSQGVTGRGVVIAVVDDGVEHSNKDIVLNYNSEGSYDLNSKDSDPSPRLNNPHVDNSHGTKCAGLIAATANNSVCGVGVAHGAQVSGIRMLDGTVTDILEGQSFIYKAHVNSVFSCSWGPEDNGKTIEGPGRVAKEALELGTRNGRYGYGNIFVFASGNGGLSNDNCNFDGYANSIYTLTIGAVDEVNKMPYYAEPCPSMLAVTYSNGRASAVDRSIATTDASTHGGCTDSFTGTSAAAPIASGMVALMLEVRPCLSWRDVQAILVYSAVKMDVKGATWIQNGAGFHHSDQHGFGLMDAFRLTVTAAVWPLLPAMVTWSSTKNNLEAQIPNNGQILIHHLPVLEDELPEGLETLEYIAVTISLSHECRGALEISLLSPTGTLSTLVTTRRNDDSTDGLDGWTLTSARFWGESPNGTWTLSIHDDITKCSTKHTRGGVLKAWQLTVYGSEVTSEDVVFRQKLVEDAVWNGSLESSLPCPSRPPPADIHLPQLNHSQPTWSTIVIVVLIVMAVVLLIHFGLECIGKRLISVWRRRKLSSGPVLFVRGAASSEASEEEERESESEETALLAEEKGDSNKELPNVVAIEDNADSTLCQDSSLEANLSAIV